MKIYTKPLSILLATISLLGFGMAAHADSTYPNKPIRLIVPLGAGGPTDVQYRKLANLASKELGQPIIIENRPGAGTTLGPSTMAKIDKPDGYTVAAALVPLVRYPHMQKVAWDPLKDFSWIIGLGGYTFVFVVKADSPFKTMQDLVIHAKAHPNELSIGNVGAGTTQHLLGEAIGAYSGAKFTQVGFKSGPESMQNLLGGHITATVDAIGTVLPSVRSGDLRILMSFDEQPRGNLPGVPTAKSLGYDLEYPSPYGLVGPRGMSPQVVKRLHDAFKVAAESQENRELLDTIGQTYWYRSSADYEAWAKNAFVSERAMLERSNLLMKN